MNPSSLPTFVLGLKVINSFANTQIRLLNISAIILILLFVQVPALPRNCSYFPIFLPLPIEDYTWQIQINSVILKEVLFLQFVTFYFFSFSAFLFSNEHAIIIARRRMMNALSVSLLASSVCPPSHKP